MPLTLALLALLGTAQAQEPQLQSLFAGGDTMLGRWVPQCQARNGTQDAFAQVSDLVAEADVALTNLECVVATTGDFFDKGERRPFLYRAPPETLDFLTDAGFDVVATANNHSMDYGPEALVEQLELLEAAGIAYAGSGADLTQARTPTYVRSGDVVLAFIGVEDTFPMYGATEERAGNLHASTEDMVEALREPIAEARQHAHLVVVTPHWGKNWVDEPTPERVEVARQIIELGADAVLGHSSHHIHGVEVWEGKPIVYDMGSLFFDAVGQENLRFSAGWVLDFDQAGFHTLRVHPLLLKSCKVTKANRHALEKIQGWLEERSKALDPDIPISWEGDAMVVQLEPGSAQPPATEPAQVHATGSSHTLPEPYRSRRPQQVLTEPPEWCTGFEPVQLEHGVEVLCWRHAEAVRPRRGFVAEVVLRPTQPLTGRWEGITVGVHQKTGYFFEHLHPIADGAWIPDKWEEGQIVVDRTLVRPPELEVGTYDLAFRLVDVLDHKKPARIVGAPEGANPTDVPMGELRVLKSTIPKGPAGVTWDGKLPDKFKKKARSKEATADGGGHGSGLMIWVMLIVGLLPALGLAAINLGGRRS